jgi:hypothetical protein
VGLVHRDRREAALEKVAAPPATGVQDVGVAPVSLAYGEPALISGDEDQVDTCLGVRRYAQISTPRLLVRSARRSR